MSYLIKRQLRALHDIGNALLRLSSFWGPLLKAGIFTAIKSSCKCNITRSYKSQIQKMKHRWNSLSQLILFNALNCMLFTSNNAVAAEAPQPSVSNTTITWPAVDAITINVQLQFPTFPLLFVPWCFILI